MTRIEFLTEHQAAVALAEAWNRLDPSELIDLMADDVHYCSQRVLEELTTKETVAEYLRERMRLTADDVATKPYVKVFAELGNSGNSQECDCVVIAQGAVENIVTIVFLKVEGSRIKRIDLCVPQFQEVIRSGVYPGGY
jgi:hypothetical protein